MTIERSPSELYRDYLRPELGKLLKLLRLDVEYTRGEGDKLQARLPHGESAWVHDFLGGYGSCLLGHNHPAILEAAQEFLKDRRVIHAQASVRGIAAKLGSELCELLRQQTHDERRFITTFANSGAEAVEAALKHAQLAWLEQKRELTLKVQSAIARGKIQSTELIQRKLRELEELSPVLWAVEKSFHGKTPGAAQATANPSYRSMYSRQLFQTHWWKKTATEDELRSALAESEWSLTADGARFRLPAVIGFLYEPIQGEGGVHELPPSFLQSMRDLLRPLKIPMIADEIQSGLWRTGDMLASTKSGVRPDYVLLGKGFGGGFAKISAVMIAEDFYQNKFGFLHTSTFAEDDFSSTLARRTLEVLIRARAEIHERAEAFEDRMRRFVGDLQAAFPGTIREIRGRGFFLGIEFAFDEDDPVPDVLYGLAAQGHAGYVLSGFLLHRHRLRVGVTMSSGSTLRLEPSAWIDESSLQALEEGLRDVTAIIHRRLFLRLTEHLWEKKFSEEELRSVSAPRCPRPRTQARRVAFVTHMLDAAETQNMDLALRHVPVRELDSFFQEYASQASPFRFHRQMIRGLEGREVELNLIGLMRPSGWFERQIRSGGPEAAKVVQEVADLAGELGCELLGLGQFTSIVSENGLLVQPPKGLALTTGNSLTAGFALKAIERIALDRRKPISQSKVGVVGFTGNICNVITQMLAGACRELVLLHREAFDGSKKFQAAVDQLVQNTRIHPERLRMSHDPVDLRDCDYVIVGTNSTRAFLGPEHFREDAVILDISVPSNVKPEVQAQSKIQYLAGGLARLPFDQRIEHPWYFLRDTPDTYACLAETLVLGLHGRQGSHSLGRLKPDDVLKSLRLAEECGVSLGGFRKPFETSKPQRPEPAAEPASAVRPSL